MNNLLIALMLVLMGQRWDVIHEAGTSCPSHTGTSICIRHWPEWRLVYVIGEQVPNLNVCSVNCSGPIVERFTIPVPNMSTKAMTRDEAERVNKELMK